MENTINEVVEEVVTNNEVIEQAAATAVSLKDFTLADYAVAGLALVGALAAGKFIGVGVKKGINWAKAKIASKKNNASGETEEVFEEVSEEE